MAAYQEHKAELDALGATVYAVSVDPLDKAQEVVTKHGITFPVAYGGNKEDADLVGGWGFKDRNSFHPSEFILGRSGVVLGSVYASGPVGRMGWDEVVRQITSRERRRIEQEQGKQ